jgi:type II secretory pathway component PulF
VESVRVSAKTVKNLFLEQQIQQMIVLLEKGADISSAIFSNPYFKPVVVDIIKTGSCVGRLEEATNKAIEFLQQDFETSVERFTQVFPIVVYLLVAIYVGYIVISFYTKHYSRIFLL